MDMNWELSSTLMKLNHFLADSEQNMYKDTSEFAEWGISNQHYL